MIVHFKLSTDDLIVCSCNRIHRDREQLSECSCGQLMCSHVDCHADCFAACTNESYADDKSKAALSAQDLFELLQHLPPAVREESCVVINDTVVIGMDADADASDDDRSLVRLLTFEDIEPE